MGEYGKPGFLHLNAANQWPQFQRRGLELGADGVLRLYRLPGLETELPAEIEKAQAQEQPAGVAVAWEGSVYYTDQGQLRRIDGCSGEPGVSICSGTGLAAVAGGTLIAVADPANERILLFDVARGTVVEIRQPIPVGAIASDERADLYVADATGNRIRRFDRFGVARWESAAPAIDHPTAIAAAGGRVFALGKDASRDGWEIVSWKPGSADPPKIHGAGMLEQPAGLAASGEAVYVGDNKLRRVLKIAVESDSLSGAAVGYRGPVAALTLDGRGGLYVYAGGGAAPLRLAVDAGSVASGVLWGRVNAPKGLPVTWHRAHASIQPGGEGSHYQFFVAAKAPPPPAAAAQPFGAGWDAKGLDVDDFFPGVGKTTTFWLGAHLFSDGSSTPALSQIQVNYDQPAYLAFLPPFYRDQGHCGDFLLRYLSLFESFFAEEETAIRSLPALFDPDSAPLDALRWLGSWMAIDWYESWDEAKQREVIRKAFDLYGRRGTVQGLREALELFAGVRALVYEPIRETSWWGLPSPLDCAGGGEPTSSSLGATTTLAAAEPQGAVVGISAVLDRSHLIRNTDYGKPLFEQTAHQFSVVLYSGQTSCPEAVAKAREILDRERPAHTNFQLCVVEPRMRVGQQARVGIDAVVGGTPPPGRLGDAGGLRLAGEPESRLGGGAGSQMRVGINTRI